MGHELRRPEADFLRDGIYELVRRSLREAFTTDSSGLLRDWCSGLHGLRKRSVPLKEINRAVERAAKV